MFVFSRLVYERYKFSRLRRFVFAITDWQSELLDELSVQGFAVLPGYMSEHDCRSLRDVLDDAVSQEEQDVQWDSTATDARIIGAQRLDHRIYRFYEDSNISGVSNMFYGEPASNLFVLGGRLKFNGTNMGSGNGWHRDSFSPQLKAMLYLSDVEGSNGPFQFVPGSHKFSHMWRFNRFLRQTELSKRYTDDQVNEFCSNHGERTWVEFTGLAGTLIVFDSSGLHRGAPIREGERYALTSYMMRDRSINDAKLAKFGLRKS